MIVLKSPLESIGDEFIPETGADGRNIKHMQQRLASKDEPSGGAMRKPCFKIPGGALSPKRDRSGGDENKPAKLVERDPCQSNNLSPSSKSSNPEASHAFVSSALHEKSRHIWGGRRGCPANDEPFDSEGMLDVNLEITMRRSMCVLSIGLESLEFLALGINRIHIGEPEAMKMRIDGIEWLASFVHGDS
jgi:hypothetical protein